ncbi:MAG: rifampicin phosphotransferase, partial [Solirubrobacteraceae bacterium]|nr:rifampicin phosphotransferase [Solirubrobacteraceae bacterium]
MLHDQAGPDNLWTNRNTAEALPGVVTPLGWSFWGRALELAMRGAFYEMGVLRRDEVRYSYDVDERYTGVFYGRFCANVNLLRYVGAATPGTTADAVEEQIFGSARSGEKSANVISRYPVVAVKLPLAAKRMPRVIGAMRESYEPWWQAGTSAAARADFAGAPARFAEAAKRFHDVMRPHSLATMLAQGLYDQLLGLAAAAGQPGLEMRLATGYGGMEEVQLTKDLWAVSREKLPMSVFLERHGYHGTSEGALQSHSWRESQASLEALLATYRTMGDVRSPDDIEGRRGEERAAAEAQLLAGLPASRRAGAKIVLKLAARHIPLREVGKAAFLQSIDVARAAARTHGDWLVSQGVLDDPADVFMLEAPQLMTRQTDGVRELVEERKAERERFLAIRMPDTWTGRPEPVAVVEETAAPDELTGLAVAPGVVEGIACVIHDPESGIDLDDGEILVCQTTDPSWASFFLVAGA